MTMTYLQGMAYELARELVSAKIGNLSHEIGTEQQKLHPSDARITALEAKLIALAQEREALDPENDETVRNLIIRLSRTGRFPAELAGGGR